MEEDIKMDKKKKKVSKNVKRVCGRNLTGIELACILVFSLCSISVSQKEKSMSQQRIPLFKVENIVFKQAIRRLAEQANVPICLETLPVPKGTQGLRHRISLQMVNTTVKEVLDTLVTQDPRYFWHEENGIINFLPRDVKDDKAYPLNRELSRFKVDAKPLTKSLILLINQAHQEIGLTFAQFRCALGGTFSPCIGTFYREFITLDVKDATLRDILNAIAREMGDCYWSYGGKGDYWTFAFLPLPKKCDDYRTTTKKAHSKIFFQEKEYDFGEVIQGDKITHTFKFKNIGVDPLEIKGTEPSIGCPIGAIFNISDEVFMPSEEGTIKATFDSKGRAGPQLYIIRVYSNDPDNPVTKLIMKGTVVAK